MPFDEFNFAFERGQGGLVRIDAKHVLHPIIFADALMDHVLVRRSRARLRSKLHVAVGQLRPNGQCLYCFRSVSFYQKVIPAHRNTPKDYSHACAQERVSTFTMIHSPRVRLRAPSYPFQIFLAWH